jgi:uncharacterized membrane protein (UPF0127 family)
MTYPRLPQLWFSAVSLLLLAFAATGADTRKADGTDAADLDRTFRRSTLQIATPDARLHKFNVWIADDEARRARGLMFVQHLAAQDGMLFVYPQPQAIAMWMKNTFVPLDMLFVAADGKVVTVVANTEPHSLKTIESGGIVLGVVELAGGTAARLKIAPGAQVIHPAFSTAAR